MAIYIREDKTTEWYPDSNCEKEKRLTIGPLTRNTERQFIGTVNSTARILNMLSTGSIEEEDFYKGLSTNAQHIGVSEETLLQLATQKLETDRQKQEA